MSVRASSGTSLATLISLILLYVVLIVLVLVFAGQVLADLSFTRNSAGVAVVIIAVYSFLALRRVYGQGRFLTVLKMVVLFFGYLVAIIATMILTLALTVVTV